MTEPAHLTAFLLEDQRQRWQGGQPLWVEVYLEQHPLICADKSAVLKLIHNEIVLRAAHGDAPYLVEYLRRFSQLEAELRPLFPEQYLLDEGIRTQAVALAGAQPLTASVTPPQNPVTELPTVPGYQVLGELGRGGMGVVYLARQLQLKRLVALKMILSGACASATERARFRTESEAVARLAHPNIVQIYEVGEHEGRPFSALEYVEGGRLDSLMIATPPSPEQAARLVETLAWAIDCAHRLGILHRDLKPANVLLTVDGVPKITDFGLAKLLDAEAGLTATESFCGTPNYMPPEQAAGKLKDAGVAADVYSLGAILYYLLARRPPFQGTTLLATLEQVRTEEPVPPRQFQGNIPHDLETVCLKCLEKDPSRRYGSAAALAEDLQLFLAGEPIEARPVAAWRHLWRRARRRPLGLASGLGMAALLCLAGTVCWHLQVAGRLAQQDSADKYRQFVRHRNEAMFLGVLAPDTEPLFSGAEIIANLKAAERAAREALALAGVRAEGEPIALDPCFVDPQRAEMTTDCYALLLVLAEAQARQVLPGPAAADRYRQALRILDRAPQLGLRTQAYHLRRSWLLDLLGEKQLAQQEKDRADGLPPQGALDHFLIGESRYRRGDQEGAGRAFDQALAAAPGHFWAQLYLAVCQLRGQRWEAARAGLNACLAQQPDFVWAYLLRSFAHEGLGAARQAEDDFRKVSQLEPNEDVRYILFVTRGIHRFHRQNLQEAADDFRAAIALRPGQYNAYLNLAQVYLAQKHFARADEQVQRALALQPPATVLFGYHLERGRNRYRDGQYEDAIRACDLAGQIAPDHPLPDDLRGRALLRLGRYELAAREFGQYLRKGGNAVPDVFRARGLAYMKLGRYADAVDDYTRVLEKEPDTEIYQHRGWAHFFSDAWKLAVRDFDRAIELNPKAGDAYTGRGLARVMLGRAREAVADAEAALRRKPGSPEMMHNVACIFAQAAVQVEADRQLPDRAVQAAAHRSRALDAIRHALQMLHPKDRLPFWRDKVLPEPALAPLRDHPDFQRIPHAFLGADNVGWNDTLPGLE